MANLEVTNWFGDLVWQPKVLVEANSTQDVINVMKNPAQYPPPVRVIGSAHSTARCNVADGGTAVKMKMNRILNVTSDSITAEAGALYIDLSQELEKHQLQFHVNTEIGSLSVGSAATAGTKDASMPGEFGQVNSYVIAVKMVLPSGDVVEITEAQPDLMQKVRSSYGLFGIVTEATFRVRPLQPMKVYHETYALKDFIAKLPELKARNESMFYYIFPFANLITIEFRKYNPGATGTPNRHVWLLRNYLWATAGPRFCHDIEKDVPVPAIRYAIIDDFCAMWRFKLEHLIKSDYTIAADETIRYPEVSDDSRYTFSLWAFPEEDYPAILSAYFQFCRDYHQQKGYRTNMLNVGYRIVKDTSSLLSYSYNGNVMTIDPVSTANPGWKPFLETYNEFSSNHGGVPLLNQTYGVTRAQAQKALGDRLKVFAEARKSYDPGDRLLNDYFRDLLTP